MVTIRATFRTAGPWKLFGHLDDYQAEIPPFPVDGVIDGHFDSGLVLLGNDDQVYTVRHLPWGWSKRWSKQAAKREARPARKRWLARHRFNRILAQMRD